ncbi:MAG: isoprenylcysteine carboxylmethyltransferase family protein [Acidobacteria bacterium]|nr:isoprenylcysteine carboxylmethyltransferase family protein [Acidobacteriota bacterium]
MRRVDFPKFAQKIRVPVGFIFVGFFLVFSRPRPATAAGGFVIAAAGLAMRLWAAGCIEKSRELEVRGPYRYTRNPLYLGSFLAGIGCCVAAANFWLLLAFIALFFAVYHPVMKKEEEEMQNLFPNEFPHYKRAVPPFLPSMPAARHKPMPSYDGPLPALSSVRLAMTDSAPRFRWSRLWRNKEYNAILGFMAIFAWICFRLWKN